MPLKSRNTSGPVVIVCKEIAYAFPFGIAYLAGYLRERGEDVRVFFRPEHEGHYKSFVQEILALKPLVVGFGSLYPDLYGIEKMVKMLDEEGRAFPVVIGGQMVSPTPEFSMELIGADYGVIGEGEIVFHQMVTQLRDGKDASDVKGLIVRDGNAFKQTGMGPFIQDLSKLPKIPYDLFPTDKWLNIGKFYARYAQPHWHYNDRIMSIHGGRGCAFKCNFCFHHDKPRYRPISDMMAEAEDLLARYDGNILYFGDDLVLATPKRAKELTEAIVKLKKKVEYSVSCRFDILSKMDDGLLQELKRTGCRIMGLGLESGSQRILDVMNKKIKVEQIVSGLGRLKKAGILPTVSIMVGQLTETREDVEKSYELMLNSVRENKCIQYAFTITTPFPGSSLYLYAFEKGLIKSHRDFYDRFSPTTQMVGLSVNVSEMSDREVIEWRNRLEATFISEITRLRGKGVMKVEAMRQKMAKVDTFLRSRYFWNSRKKKTVALLEKAFETSYDSAQMVLDKTRLKMLGIEKRL